MTLHIKGENLRLNPTRDNTRAQLVGMARNAQARTIAPRELLEVFPTQKAVQETYTAILACNAVGIEAPTYHEIAIVASVSRGSVALALYQLVTADFIRKIKARLAGQRWHYHTPKHKGCGWPLANDDWLTPRD